MYKILSLDGGGLRGLITARMLQRLNAEPAIAGWLDQVDLIAGTSTGGILALGLAAGKTPQQIADLYKIKGPDIFDDSLLDDVLDLGRTIGAEYSSKTLKKELRSIFGNTTLAQLGKKVVIPTFDLDNEATGRNERTWKPKIFHNFSGADTDGEFLAADIALYTSSAPTYFPSADGYIDGGVFANNPSVVALVQAISRRNKPAERARIDDVVLLSVGTGKTLNYIKGKSLDWGYAQWVKPLMNILMDGVAGIADYQSSQLLGDSYKRLQIIFDETESIPLDAVDKLDRMDQIGSSVVLTDTIEWIQTQWV
ncbi:patatin-like phospholipase family protein [Polaromonas sp.]|uniref:patatin-like phospholipase family protein n=1 Tax=Polaromonas sp. TaxID=1869339 RepID=UPI00286CD09C|nr:patatin-like phospholipase family protein [Polaromonas sp.]